MPGGAGDHYHVIDDGIIIAEDGSAPPDSRDSRTTESFQHARVCRFEAINEEIDLRTARSSGAAATPHCNRNPDLRGLRGLKKAILISYPMIPKESGDRWVDLRPFALRIMVSTARVSAQLVNRARRLARLLLLISQRGHNRARAFSLVAALKFTCSHTYQRVARCQLSFQPDFDFCYQPAGLLINGGSRLQVARYT